MYSLNEYNITNQFNYIVEVDESCLPEGKTANDLYKNWGEDFWRVREE